MIGLMEYFNRAPGIVGGDKKKAEEMPGQIMAINKVDGYLAKVPLALTQQIRRRPAGEIEQVVGAGRPGRSVAYEPHINLASIYASGAAPRWELAEKEALTAKKIDADRTAPYSILAAVYATAERWPELDAVLAEAEKKIPDNLSPYLRASGALLASGKDLARAERYARKYLSQEPEPNRIDARGGALAARTDPREAGEEARGDCGAADRDEARSEVRAGAEGPEAAQARVRSSARPPKSIVRSLSRAAHFVSGRDALLDAAVEGDAAVDDHLHVLIEVELIGRQQQREFLHAARRGRDRVAGRA